LDWASEQHILNTPQKSSKIEKELSVTPYNPFENNFSITCT